MKDHFPGDWEGIEVVMPTGIVTGPSRRGRGVKWDGGILLQSRRADPMCAVGESVHPKGQVRWK